MRVVAIINQKGGVGKTTTAVNLAHALVLAGFRVLALDFDPQGHLAPCYGLHRLPPFGMDRVLLEGGRLDEYAHQVKQHLRLVPAGSSLGDVEYREGGTRRASVLKQVLVDSPPDVDYVVIDSSPSSGVLMLNAACAASDILVPMAGDYLSLTGVARLMLTLKRLQPLRDPAAVDWIYFNRLHPRRRLAQEVYAKVLHHFPQQLLRTAVPEAAVLAECAGAGKTIFDYAAKSRSAAVFAALADDLINRRVQANEQETTSHVA